MTYDLHILRVDPGDLGRVSPADLVNPQGEPAWPPTELTDEQMDVWDRIVRRVRDHAGDATADVYPTYTELSLRDPRVRLHYEGERATVQIPYWYSGDDALNALQCGYAIARIVADEAGLVAFDTVIGKALP